MSKTIVVVGFGPGISTAVAERLGAAGFSIGGKPGHDIFTQSQILAGVPGAG